MNFSNEAMKLNWTTELRHRRTLKTIAPISPRGSAILDLGYSNTLADRMRDAGYAVQNTDVDLDLFPSYCWRVAEDKTSYCYENYDFVTAFEVFEHLVNPYSVLRLLRSEKLLATVPLNVWFRSAYWNENDEFDCHFHEFEPRQFDMLLEKAGWRIVRREKWKLGLQGIGIRPVLRLFWSSYYFVYAERI